MSDCNDALMILGGASLLRGGGGGRTATAEPAEASTSAVEASSLRGKILLLFFSAHWCPPCRMFTPVLARQYEKLQSEGKRMECIFVSLDRGRDQFNDYVSSMPPWLVVPYEMDGQRSQLADLYGAHNIPHLTVIDADGTVITLDATEEVAAGACFPWRPPSLAEIWPDRIVVHSKEDGDDVMHIPSSTLRDKYLMLYFSASWCAPCRRFLPTLSAAYTEMKMAKYKDDFELVFVSSDRERGQFDEYRREMTFPALDFEERRARGALSRRYDVRGIPRLIMLGPADDHGERTLINDGVKGIIEAGNLDDFPFRKKKYNVRFCLDTCCSGEKD